MTKSYIDKAIELVDRIDDETFAALSLISCIMSVGPTTGDILKGFAIIDRIFGNIGCEKLPNGRKWLEYLDAMGCIRVSEFIGIKKFIDFECEVLWGRRLSKDNLYATADGGILYYIMTRYPENYNPTPAPTTPPTNGWFQSSGKSYWYENNTRQGTFTDPKGVLGNGTVRGREIYDPASDAWYWLDSIYEGAKAIDKEVWMPYIYQNEKQWSREEIERNATASGSMKQQVIDAITQGKGKWVRYDHEGRMIKGWYVVTGSDIQLYPKQAGCVYYYDPKTGLMAKGTVIIDGVSYTFDEKTGALLTAPPRLN